MSEKRKIVLEQSDQLGWTVTSMPEDFNVRDLAQVHRKLDLFQRGMRVQAKLARAKELLKQETLKEEKNAK